MHGAAGLSTVCGWALLGIPVRHYIACSQLLAPAASAAGVLRMLRACGCCAYTAAVS